MNIFYLDDNIQTCARYHCDKHVVKMILESAQMLSTVCNKLGIETQYRPVHKNHPCTLWAGKSLANWLWLRELVVELHREWQYRFNHPASIEHKSYTVAMALPEPPIENYGITARPKCVTEPFKKLPVVEAYRQYYIHEKAGFCTWKNRPVPEWFNNE